jgi:hypothetical protein
MKKIFIITTMVLVLFSTMAIASPFLVADPQSNEVVSYKLIVNGVEVVSTPEFVDASTVRLHYDLQGVPVGSNSIDVIADYGVWGESVSVPFPFVKPAITIPANIGIVK